MYYIKGIVFGIVMSLLQTVGIYVSINYNLATESSVELVMYTMWIVILFVIGFKFRTKTKLGFIQLLRPENVQYIYFPFGISTTTAFSQALFTYLNEGDISSFWFAPFGVLGHGAHYSTLIIFGVLCNRKKN